MEIHVSGFDEFVQELFVDLLPNIRKTEIQKDSALELSEILKRKQKITYILKCVQ